MSESGQPHLLQLRSLHIDSRPDAQGREKIGLIETFLRLGVNILVSDVDTVWCSRPLTACLQQYA